MNKLAQTAKSGAVLKQNQATTSGQCILGKYRKNKAPPRCDKETQSMHCHKHSSLPKMTTSLENTHGNSSCDTGVMHKECEMTDIARPLQERAGSNIL